MVLKSMMHVFFTGPSRARHLSGAVLLVSVLGWGCHNRVLDPDLEEASLEGEKSSTGFRADLSLSPPQCLSSEPLQVHLRLVSDEEEEFKAGFSLESWHLLRYASELGTSCQGQLCSRAELGTCLPVGCALSSGLQSFYLLPEGDPPGHYQLTLHLRNAAGVRRSVSARYEVVDSSYEVRGFVQGEDQVLLQITNLPTALRTSPWRVMQAHWSPGLSGSCDELDSEGGVSSRKSLRLRAHLTSEELCEAPQVALQIEGPDKRPRSVAIMLTDQVVKSVGRGLCSLSQELSDRLLSIDQERQGQITGPKRLQQKALSGLLLQTESYAKHVAAQLGRADRDLRFLATVPSSQEGSAQVLREAQGHYAHCQSLHADLLEQVKGLSSHQYLLQHFPEAASVTHGLFSALAQHRLEAIEVLSGSPDLDLEASNGQGSSLLSLACEGGDLSLVRRLLSRGASPGSEDHQGKSALHRSLQHPAIVLALLDAGARVDHADHQGARPLHRAELLSACHVEGASQSALYLLERGADRYALDAKGRTASEASLFPLHEAIHQGEELCVDSLLRAIPEVLEQENEVGLRPTMEAALLGGVSTLRKLHECGADLSVLTARDGATLLHLGARQGHCGVVSFLLRQGSSIEARSRGIGGSKTALEEALCGGHHEVAELLLKHGASVEGSKGGSVESSLLLEVIGRRDQAGAALLLQYDRKDELVNKAIVRRECFEGDTRQETNFSTPLLAAVRHNDSGMVSLLLSKGARINEVVWNLWSREGLMKKCRSKTVLDIAHERGYTKIVELLRASGGQRGGERRCFGMIDFPSP